MNNYSIRFLLCLMVVIGLCQCSEEKSPNPDGADQAIIGTFLADNNLKSATTSTGLHYLKLIENDSSRSVQQGDILSIYYKISVLGGNVLEDKSDTSLAPSFLKYGANAVLPIGLEEGLGIMNIREKYRFLVSSKLGYGNLNIENPNKKDIYDIEVFIDTSYSGVDFEALEIKNIENHIKDNDLKNVVLGAEGKLSAIYYQTISSGLGTVLPINGDSVNVNFVLKEIGGGTLSSAPRLPFHLGQNEIFEGLDLVVRNMKYGESGVAFMTSGVAYKESAFVIPQRMAESLAEALIIPAYALNIKPYTTLEVQVTLSAK